MQDIMVLVKHVVSIDLTIAVHENDCHPDQDGHSKEHDKHSPLHKDLGNECDLVRSLHPQQLPSLDPKAQKQI